MKRKGKKIIMIIMMMVIAMIVITTTTHVVSNTTVLRFAGWDSKSQPGESESIDSHIIWQMFRVNQCNSYWLKSVNPQTFHAINWYLWERGEKSDVSRLRTQAVVCIGPSCCHCAKGKKRRENDDDFMNSKHIRSSWNCRVHRWGEETINSWGEKSMGWGDMWGDCANGASTRLEYFSLC